MSAKIEQLRYRMPLCPYLTTGNHRIFVHLDAYCVPQSLQWPTPGSADRLGWRNFSDEWPYWEEMTEDAIRSRMPYFEYPNGRKDYLHDAIEIENSYMEDTNIIEGRYVLPGGAVVEITTFVPPGKDIWVRHFSVKGQGKFVHQSEFFEKSVRGHALGHMGNVNFKGFFDAAPRGVFVIMSTLQLAQVNQLVEVNVAGDLTWTVFMCIADDMRSAVKIGEDALATGYEALKRETADSDRRWVAQAKQPVSRHPLILKNYKRWLLSNALLISKDGVTISGSRPFWTFAWPRDCSQQAAGFAAAGFIKEAQDILKWNFDNTPESGVHEARYWSDGTPVMLDNRPRQGDSAGFLCWTAAFVSRQIWDQKWIESIKEKLYFIADHLVKDKDQETLLPLPEADHRETQVAESISIAVSAVGGLLGAAEIADKLGDSERAEKYTERAREIRKAAEIHLWNEQENCFITSVKPLNEKVDISICWGAGFFNVWNADDSKLKQSVLKVFNNRWNIDAGGVISMPGTPYASYWMYYTSILLLGIAGIKDKNKEAEILGSLERNISPQGLIPEQISLATGNLWGCAPLPPPQANLLFYAYMK